MYKACQLATAFNIDNKTISDDHIKRVRNATHTTVSNETIFKNHYINNKKLKI